MSLKIYFENNQEKHSIHYKLKMLIRHTILETLDYEGMENDAEVSVTFVDDEGIRELNKKFRNMDKPTDVLSFPINDFMYGDGEIDIFNSNEETQNLMLGDIIISVPTMKKQADEYGHGKDRECAFLVCHGMLHLLGYDHMNEEDEKQMFKHADDILNSIGFIR